MNRGLVKLSSSHPRARARAPGRRRHAGRAFREPGEVRRRATADALPGVAVRDPAGSLRLAVRAEPRVFVVGVFVLRRVARLAAHHLAEHVRVLRVRVLVAEDGETRLRLRRQLVLALRAGCGLVLRLEDALRPEQAPARRAPFPRRRPVLPVFFFRLPEPARERLPGRRADVGRGVVHVVGREVHVPVPLHRQRRQSQPPARRVAVAVEEQHLPVVRGQHDLQPARARIDHHGRGVHGGLVERRPRAPRARVLALEHLEVVHERRHHDLPVSVAVQVRDHGRGVNAAGDLGHPAQTHVRGALVPRARRLVVVVRVGQRLAVQELVVPASHHAVVVNGVRDLRERGGRRGSERRERYQRHQRHDVARHRADKPPGTPRACRRFWDRDGVRTKTW